MSLIRWDPFTDFDRMFGRMLTRGWPRVALDVEDSRMEWAPSANISETEKEYLIRAELPAVKKEDVKVTIDNGLITISGERRQEKEDKNEKFHRVESFQGTFMRTFSLPENADSDSVRCDSKDGVLTVHIGKKAADTKKARQIKVD